MPVEESLPDDLKPLARRHALELRHTRFNADADAILHALEDLTPKTGLPRWPIFAGAGVAAAVVVAAVFWPKLSLMLRPAGPPTVVTAPKPPVAKVQKPPATAMPAAPNLPPGAQQSATSSSASRDHNPVDGGMTVTIGDTGQAISAAYKTRQQLTPSPWDKKNKWLYLKDEGIEFFFDSSDRISSIHFVDPWAGSIHGVKLGDTADKVIRLLGQPKTSEQRFGGDTTAMTYRWPYTLTVEFHVKRASNKVEIIILN
jgi:hypothetical protein